MSVATMTDIIALHEIEVLRNCLLLVIWMRSAVMGRSEIKQHSRSVVAVLYNGFVMRSD